MRDALVVDDSKVVRKVCRQILEEIGFSVREAADGREALGECQKKLPEVILLDWNMPEMDGMKFLQEFRRMANNESTKVIFCTTENEVDKIQKAISAGADEYVMKPFDAEIIKGKFEQLGLMSGA